MLNGWPAHAAVNASPATLRAACAGSLVEPADASLAVIVVRYSFRCGGLAPLVSRRLLPAHCVPFVSTLAECSQRALVYYETTAKCPPAPVLAKLAAAFDVSMEALMGRDEIPTRRTQHDPNLLEDPEDRKLWKKFRQIQNLSERDQAYLFKTLNMLVDAKDSSQRTA